MSIEISFQTSAKRKRSTSMRIVGKGRVEAKIPKKLPISYIADVLSKNYRFLQKSLAVSERMNLPKLIQTGNDIMIFGSHYLVEVISGKRMRISFDIENRVCSINSPTQEIESKAFYKYVSRILLPEIEKNVSRISRDMGPLIPTAIRIKMTTSQWGSCTSTNKLSFSKKLIHYPQEVINYVIVHELAHMYQHNHSRKFWEIVEKHCPNYKELRKQLKEHKYG